MRLDSHLLKSGYKKGLLFGLSLVIVFLNPIDTMENKRNDQIIPTVTETNKQEVFGYLIGLLEFLKDNYGFPENPPVAESDERIEKNIKADIRHLYAQALDGNRFAQYTFGALRFHFHKLDRPDKFCIAFTSTNFPKQFAESNPLIRNRHPIDLITHPSSSLIH